VARPRGNLRKLLKEGRVRHITASVASTPRVDVEVWIVVGATAAALAATDARATPLTLTATNPTFFDALPPDEVCVNPKTGLPGPQYNNCRVASFLSLNDGVAFGLKDTLFDQAFDEWNDDGAWTLKDGGALPGGSLQVTTFRIVANLGGTIAGVDILINWTYDGADT
jgi:hypothetical protein